MQTQPEPLTLKATRLAFSSLGAVLPEPMAALAERLYFSPRRHRMPARERAVLADGQRFTVETSAGPLAAWRFEPLFPWENSDKGVVLLAHGWEGRASQLGAFIDPLLERGFTVIGADAPAHGRSPGEAMDLPTYAHCLREVADAVGGVRAVVAHSFGGAATALALEDGLAADAAVLVAPPCSLERFAQVFARTLGLTPATEAIFRARLDERFGPEWWIKYGLDRREARIEDTAALIIHDEDDREIPVGEGAAFARSWPGAELVVTSGLGHRRILRDEQVVARTVDFLHAQVR
jgi:pimeloyl-ACP methyl ester carboxylesterase